MRLRIEPEAPPDDAAAIEAALIALFGHMSTGTAKRLRYVDIVSTQIESSDVVRSSKLDRSIAHSWRDVARLEALTQSV